MSYDTDVVAATSGRGEANWDQIIKLCDRIQQSIGPTSMTQAMASVMKRVRHSDPHVQLHALTLLEACVSNCGKDFQLELTKPAFQSDARAILTGPYSDPRVTQRLKELLASWANEFRSETRMSGLLRFVDQLRQDGINFSGLQQSAPSSRPPPTSAPPTASSREEEDLRKAIQLSLNESQAPPPSLYPSFPTASTSSTPKPQAVKSEERKVRAIYDFVAAEDNELSFRAGEIVVLLDDSDENWWRGRTHLGEGLFPASFVSKNLNVDPEPSKREKKEKKSKKGGKKQAAAEAQIAKVGVNEEKLDLLLEMLKEADVTSEENEAESQTLMELEEQCKRMKPAVEESIAALQRDEDEMQAINQKFQEALAMYRKMLAEGPKLSTMAAAQQPPPPHPTPPSHPPTSVPPPSHPHHPTYHPTTSVATGYTNTPGALYGAEVSMVPPMQAPPTHPLTQTHQPGLYQPQVQPTQQHLPLMTGAPPNISLPAQPVPPPYQPPLYQPQPVQSSLIQQPLL